MTRRLAALALLAAARAATAAVVEASYAEEVLTRGQANWRAAGVEAAWTADDRAGLALSARGVERFGLRDLELGASASAPWGTRLDLGAEASVSPTHRVLPAWSGALQLQVALGAGFAALGGVKLARYDGAAGETSATLGRVGVERYFGAHRLAWTGYLATVAGGWAGSQRIAWDLFYGERDRVGVGVALGSELESLGGSRLLVARTLAATVGGRHAVGDGWSVIYEAGLQQQGDLYTRTGARLGVRRSF